MTHRKAGASPQPASRTAAVRILDAGREVDRLDCELLTMPDGRIGALVWGLVFPVVTDAVDVAGPNVLPALCRPLVEDGSASAARFELVEGESEAVLLLDGSVVERDERAAALRSNGLTVLSIGARVTEDAREPPWFIRVARPAQGPDLVVRIAAAFTVEPARPVRPDRRVALPTDGLCRDLGAPNEPRPAADLERDRLRARVAELERALAAAAAAVPTIGDASLASTNEPAASVAPPPPARGQIRLQDEIARILSVFAPSVELVQNSLPAIVTELADRQPLYAALRELDGGDRGMPLGWKRLADARGWWERHLATGRDQTGRLYARHDPDSGRWSVLVSTKARQRRDIAWLRDRSCR